MVRILFFVGFADGKIDSKQKFKRSVIGRLLLPAQEERRDCRDVRTRALLPPKMGAAGFIRGSAQRVKVPTVGRLDGTSAHIPDVFLLVQLMA